ncbi:unnamed protein product, partial [Anisakis simplex]|uniref:Uncharacterized protein n=1 Tax=Anisakis simplex TaxID=6269 RepID=A0A0M3J8J7_ANISI
MGTGLGRGHFPGKAEGFTEFPPGRQEALGERMTSCAVLIRNALRLACCCSCNCNRSCKNLTLHYLKIYFMWLIYRIKSESGNPLKTRTGMAMHSKLTAYIGLSDEVMMSVVRAGSMRSERFYSMGSRVGGGGGGRQLRTTPPAALIAPPPAQLS